MDELLSSCDEILRKKTILDSQNVEIFQQLDRCTQLLNDIRQSQSEAAKRTPQPVRAAAVVKPMEKEPPPRPANRAVTLPPGSNLDSAKTNGFGLHLSKQNTSSQSNLLSDKHKIRRKAPDPPTAPSPAKVPPPRPPLPPQRKNSAPPSTTVSSTTKSPYLNMSAMQSEIEKIKYCDSDSLKITAFSADFSFNEPDYTRNDSKHTNGTKDVKNENDTHTEEQKISALDCIEITQDFIYNSSDNDLIDSPSSACSDVSCTDVVMETCTMYDI